MRLILFTLLLVLFGINIGYSQFTFDQFEQEVLDFDPGQIPGVSAKALQFAQMVLEETRSATGGDPSAFNVADYMNVLSVFASLQLSLEEMHLAFRKLTSAEDHCTYLRAFRQKVMENDKYSPILDAWMEALQGCAGEMLKNDRAMSPREYAREHQLDPDLIAALDEIKTADQQVRTDGSISDSNQREMVDRRNQLRIDSLFELYGTYLGKAQVGERYEWTMWAVIQHAPLSFMERYLPVVHKAYLKEDLAVAPFKMLLDRYHGLKYGYQLFGSQSGFGFTNADDDTRERIKRTYGIK